MPPRNGARMPHVAGVSRRTEVRHEEDKPVEDPDVATADGKAPDMATAGTRGPRDVTA
jgi:hypothetical protein